jgi:hypothetical protein
MMLSKYTIYAEQVSETSVLVFVIIENVTCFGVALTTSLEIFSGMCILSLLRTEGASLVIDVRLYVIIRKFLTYCSLWFGVLKGTTNSLVRANIDNFNNLLYLSDM